MMRYVTGKKGGGKSYFAMRILKRYLLKTAFSIVTNLPLVWDKLEAYYDKHRQPDSLPLSQRVRQIHGLDSCEFFRFRGFYQGRWVELPKFAKDQDYCYSAKDNGPGVLYLIDEIHVYFNSRRWQSATKAALDYVTLEDKIADQSFLISQNLGQVDKYFRSLGNEYIEVRNLGRERLFGYFKQPKVFTHVTYYDLPGPNAQRGPSGTFTLELDGLADCYDSSAGQGVEGLLQDRGESTADSGGIPFWVLFLIIGLIGWGVVQLPTLLGKGIGKAAMALATGVSAGSTNMAAQMMGNATGAMAAAKAADAPPELRRSAELASALTLPAPEPLATPSAFGHALPVVSSPRKKQG